MKFKVLLGLFIIALFIYALTISPFTSSFFSKPFFTQIKLPSGLFNLLNLPSNKNYFEINSEFSSFSSISSFEIENSSFDLGGICLGSLEINGAFIQEPSHACKIKGFAKNGKIDISGNSMILNLESSSLRVNERFIKNGNVRLYVVPFTFNFENVKSEKMVVKKANGRVEKIVNEKVDLIKMVYGSDLTFENFKGSLSKTNSTLTLKGITTKVKGSDFEW